MDVSDDLGRFVAESNRIEGILRPPTDAEMRAAAEFIGRPATIDSLVALVSVMQPGARLRDRAGLNVRVGGHYPPAGGSAIRTGLLLILADAVWGEDSPYGVHVRYESLHPFTDGNGRSGRLLWLWQHVQLGTDAIVLRRGFLHSFYYEALQASRQPAAED